MLVYSVYTAELPTVMYDEHVLKSLKVLEFNEGKIKPLKVRKIDLVLE